jgi:hypothetical protein
MRFLLKRIVVPKCYSVVREIRDFTHNAVSECNGDVSTTKLIGELSKFIGIRGGATGQRKQTDTPHNKKVPPDYTEWLRWSPRSSAVVSSPFEEKGNGSSKR